MFALQFPTPYLIDTEPGATREQYTPLIKKSGGSYFGVEQGSQDFRTVVEEIKNLATTPNHGFKTLIIDSFSKIYNLETAAAEERSGKSDAFAMTRARSEANRPTRQMMKWIDRIDMVVILICHQKDKWERIGGELQVTDSIFDGWAKLEYDLDLWMETKMIGTTRLMRVRKSRIEAFPLGSEMPMNYATFAKRYGQELIEQKPKNIVLTNPADILEIKRRVELLKIEPETIDKWLTKAQAIEWEDVSEDFAKRLLEYLQKVIEGKETV